MILDPWLDRDGVDRKTGSKKALAPQLIGDHVQWQLKPGASECQAPSGSHSLIRLPVL